MSLSPALLLATVLAGAGGAMLRFALDRWLSPRGILAANALAALLLGAAWPVLGASTDAAVALPVASTFVLALGTFSTLALQAVDAAAGPSAAGTGTGSGAAIGRAARLWALHLGLGTAAFVVGFWTGAWALWPPL